MRVPGALGFCATALLARAGSAMTGIGIVLMVSSLYGSYGWAGALVAANSIGWAVGNAVLSNLVDRFGQRRVMLPATVIANVAVLALALAGGLHAPVWLLFVPGVIAGVFFGSPGASVRTRWRRVLTDERQLQTAFSLESTLDELTYLVGPVLVTALATLVHPTAGLVFKGVLGLVGGIAFFGWQRASEPPAASLAVRADARGKPRQRFVLTFGGVAPTVAAMLCVGIVFGGIDVATVSAATTFGHRDLTGAIMATGSLASTLAGLAYGLRAWTTPLWQRFVVTLTGWGGAIWLLLLAHSPLALAAFGAVGGALVAPTMINANSLVGQLVPVRRLTEGLSWIGTAVGIGSSLGSTVAGRMIDSFGYRGGYHTVVAAGTLAALIVLGFAMVLRRCSTPATPLP